MGRFILDIQDESDTTGMSAIFDKWRTNGEGV